MEENLFSLQQFKISQETEKSIQHVKNRKVEMYAPDFKKFEVFCEQHLLPLILISLSSIYMNPSPSSRYAYPHLTVDWLA